MQTSYNEIKNKIVETISGIKIGKVCDILINTKEQFVTHYEIKTKIFGGNKLLVSRDQIVRFEKDKIIVDDNVVKENNTAIEQLGKVNAEPVAMRKSV